jgi:hypothetical protein
MTTPTKTAEELTPPFRLYERIRGVGFAVGTGPQAAALADDVRQAIESRDTRIAELEAQVAEIDQMRAHFAATVKSDYERGFDDARARVRELEKEVAAWREGMPRCERGNVADTVAPCLSPATRKCCRDWLFCDEHGFSGELYLDLPWAALVRSKSGPDARRLGASGDAGAAIGAP